jgi:hypothetical protein
MLFVYAVGAVLFPTVNSSMPKKGRFAIVEKYGDCVIAVRRFSPRQRKRYIEGGPRTGWRKANTTYRLPSHTSLAL